MPLRLDIKRELHSRSDRVKCVDLHDSEPWLLTALYNGHVQMWNYDSKTMIRSFEVHDLPVRAARFIERKNWIVCGSDDFHVRVFNYNTQEKVHTFEAHGDYIRSLAVHPSQPLVLSCSDDMQIKLWNWDKAWDCVQTLEGHTHYVMCVVFNPKDTNTFASASLDQTVKVWQIGSPQPNFTLNGHEKGVNVVDYYHGGDKPYLISGADDKLVKIWDYQVKTCVQTLEGHTQNVCSVCYHPEMPVILTGSEDGTVRVWNSGTYRAENTLNYGLERVWSMAYRKGTNNVAIGYDEGTIMIKMGREEPAVSMDSTGKIMWAKHQEVQQTNLAKMGDMTCKDGEVIALPIKDMGSCEIYPNALSHNPNGRFVVVCGDGEYIIHTALNFRNKSFGSALEFVWGPGSEYAIRESTSKVRIFAKDFKERSKVAVDYSAEGIFNGNLLAVRGSDSLHFYDWESAQHICEIEVAAQDVHWSESGDMVAIAMNDRYYILKYNGDVVAEALASGEPIVDDIEDAFEEEAEIEGQVKTAIWVGDCFIYTTSANRLNYFVGGEIVTIAHLDAPLYILGYLGSTGRLYLCDKDVNVVSFELQQSVLEYQTAVMRGDLEAADAILPSIPTEMRTRVAHFLEKQGFQEQALVVSIDVEHRFDLSLSMQRLDIALECAQKINAVEKWKQLGEKAMKLSNFDLAETCMQHAKDYSGQLMLYTAAGKGDKLASLAAAAGDDEKTNIAFIAMLLRGKVNECVDLLVNTNRIPEAALFARSYCPSRIPDVLAAWKEEVGKSNEKAARMLADPEEYANLFPELSFTKAAEQQVAAAGPLGPASSYSTVIAERATPLQERLANPGVAAAAVAADDDEDEAMAPAKEAVVDDIDLELDDDDLGDEDGGDGKIDDAELDELLDDEADD
mmetsp:Transcript_23742/g.62029  ORF Transcript_23742/g.62029 Transcript_23742/m.62029 type:complete len:903 (+) Transcript_23742:102-2810(+)|eukprot:CAMPEP_0182926066 /NCGR_PEP_ID=MMETSP0105_2-20130417/10806_1 /TAXON_ID=81532 ORGANISM="Acanthoeca-like sp., Strain 10tr" /NCGR_SAMPLE_ID=MMETSP0105_2 /ASSEMBLY_ACC=CAM_ASM_000205 /LENGTH=902 /DNA_ID=CAMNT_0025063939 /DNA_START=98 /DNA_END=2806 /DNA_ORIENTATION=+